MGVNTGFSYKGSWARQFGRILMVQTVLPSTSVCVAWPLSQIRAVSKPWTLLFYPSPRTGTWKTCFATSPMGFWFLPAIADLQNDLAWKGIIALYFRSFHIYVSVVELFVEFLVEPVAYYVIPWDCCQDSLEWCTGLHLFAECKLCFSLKGLKHNYQANLNKALNG